MIPAEDEVRASIVSHLAEAACVPVSELSQGSTRLSDLNIDSLSAVGLLWALENKYGVRLPTSETGVHNRSVDDLVLQFRSLLHEASGGPSTP